MSIATICRQKSDVISGICVANDEISVSIQGDGVVIYDGTTLVSYERLSRACRASHVIAMSLSYAVSLHA